MSATATSPRPTSHMSIDPRSSWLAVTFTFGWILAVAAVVVATAIRPTFLLPTLAIAVLFASGVALYRSVQGPTPRRLTPIGLAGSLSVKLSGDSLIVGRLPCCRVEIPLPTVSSHHCRLARQGSRWYIEDLDSRNGTFVNGRRVRKKRLHVGDEIAIGEFAFRVE